jgi:hypothetical protein
MLYPVFSIRSTARISVMGTHWSKTAMREVRRKTPMLYFLKVRVDYQRLTPGELWNRWEKEADAALRAKAAGKIVALYKVVGQRRVLIIFDAESH